MSKKFNSQFLLCLAMFVMISITSGKANAFNFSIPDHDIEYWKSDLLTVNFKVFDPDIGKNIESSVTVPDGTLGPISLENGLLAFMSYWFNEDEYRIYYTVYDQNVHKWKTDYISFDTDWGVGNPFNQNGIFAWAASYPKYNSKTLRANYVTYDPQLKTWKYDYHDSDYNSSLSFHSDYDTIFFSIGDVEYEKTYYRSLHSWGCPDIYCPNIPCEKSGPSIHVLDGEWAAYAVNRDTGPFMGFEINVTDHSGISENGDSHCVEVLFPDKCTRYKMNYSYHKNQNTALYSLYPPTSPQGGTYIFTVYNGTCGATFEDEVILSYPQIPDKNSFSPENGSTTEDTTPTFDWDMVSDASHYRVRIYKEDGSTIWNGYTRNPPYTVPSGILEPNTTYRYRIEARTNHFGFEGDVMSRAPASWEDYFIFTTGDEDQSPSIDLDFSGVTTWNNEYVEKPYVSFWIDVYDSKGVPGSIQEVTVTFPDNSTTLQLYYDYNKTDNSAVYRTHSFTPIENGIYTFTAIDKDGNISKKQENFLSNGISYPPENTLSPKANALIGSTNVAFDWEDVPGAATYILEIYNDRLQRIHRIFTTESAFSIPMGVLQENARYAYRIKTRRNFGEENYDNGSTSPTDIDFKWFQFTTTAKAGGSNSPTIDMDIWGAHTVLTSNTMGNGKDYWLAFVTIIGDADGFPENIKSVEVTYPDGITKLPLNLWRWNDDDTAWFMNADMRDTPSGFESGTYLFTVTDFDGNSVTKSDDVIIDFLPAVTSTNPEQNEMINHTTPNITWNSVDGAKFYRVRLYDSFNDMVYTSDFISNNSFTVPHNILSPNTTYGYIIYSYREDATLDIDNSSKHRHYFSQVIHFTTGEKTIAGDIDGNRVVELLDLIKTLKILSGLDVTLPLNLASDINLDWKIDLSNPIYILDKIANGF